MNYKHIWSFAEENKITAKRREKKYITVSRADFEHIRPYFKERFNILRPGLKSYRTSEHFFHLHALEKKNNTVEIHFDLANIDKLRIINFIPHTILDVIPFFLGRILFLIIMILALPKHIAKTFLQAYKYIRELLRV